MGNTNGRAGVEAERFGPNDGRAYSEANRCRGESVNAGVESLWKELAAANERMQRVLRVSMRDFIFGRRRALQVALQMRDDLEPRVATLWRKEISQQQRQTIRMTLGLWRKLHELADLDTEDSPTWKASEQCMSWPFTHNLVPTFELLGEYLRAHQDMHGNTLHALENFGTDPRGHRALSIAMEGMSLDEKLLAVEMISLAAATTWPAKERLTRPEVERSDAAETGPG